MAKISKPPVPAKLYKHFAAVTIVLTGLIAMFADEDQRLGTRQSHAQSTSATPVTPSTPAFGEARLTRAQAEISGSFGSEGDHYGAPMLNPGGDGGNRSSIARRTSNVHRQPLPNMSAEEIAALPEEEYARLRALYAAAGAIEDVDRSAQMSEVEAASARRMGHGGSDT